MNGKLLQGSFYFLLQILINLHSAQIPRDLVETMSTESVASRLKPQTYTNPAVLRKLFRYHELLYRIRHH